MPELSHKQLLDLVDRAVDLGKSDLAVGLLKDALQQAMDTGDAADKSKPKFRYYLVSVFDGYGNITGTNDRKIAEEFAGSEEDFIIDTETNEWIQAEAERVQIEEFKS